MLHHINTYGHNLTLCINPKNNFVENLFKHNEKIKPKFHDS
jgi:ABC-type proline/glycine betaine transport system ATPase subunit